MARHDYYSYLPIQRLSSDIFWYANDMEATYERERVTFNYKDNHVEFYRVPEMEAVPTKANKEMLGKKFRANRIVSWVGYAKCKRTVVFTENQVINQMVHILNESLGLELNGNVQLGGLPLRVENALRSHAKYQLVSKSLAEGKFLDRGLWFHDMLAQGTVVEIVNCQTGHYEPGYIPIGMGVYTDDYEPPCLSHLTHHQLYGCDGWANGFVLVHPDDIEETV